MARSDPVPPAHPTDRIVGDAPAIQALRAQIRHLATFDTVGSAFVPTLLLQGETGTGKGLVARVIHDSGPRAQGPFVDVNCAAIPETLLEVELFGFEAGTFTDAKRAKPGLVESALHGTLFLDEIEALPLLLQAKLLSAIDEKRVRRLGAVASRQLDVKFIAATAADLSVRRDTRDASALTSTIAWRCCSWRSPPCASAARIFWCWRSTFCASMRRRMGSLPKRLQPRRRGVAAGLWLAGQCARAEPSDGTGDAVMYGGRRHCRHPGAPVPAATAPCRPLGGACGPWRGRAPGRAGTDAPGPQPDGRQCGAGGAPFGDAAVGRCAIGCASMALDVRAWRR